VVRDGVARELPSRPAISSPTHIEIWPVSPRKRRSGSRASYRVLSRELEDGGIGQGGQRVASPGGPRDDRGERAASRGRGSGDHGLIARRLLRRRPSMRGKVSPIAVRRARQQPAPGDPHHARHRHRSSRWVLMIADHPGSERRLRARDRGIGSHTLYVQKFPWMMHGDFFITSGIVRTSPCVRRRRSSRAGLEAGRAPRLHGASVKRGDRTPAAWCSSARPEDTRDRRSRAGQRPLPDRRGCAPMRRSTACSARRWRAAVPDGRRSGPHLDRRLPDLPRGGRARRGGQIFARAWTTDLPAARRPSFRFFCFGRHRSIDIGVRVAGAATPGAAPGAAGSEIAAARDEIVGAMRRARGSGRVRRTTSP